MRVVWFLLIFQFVYCVCQQVIDSSPYVVEQTLDFLLTGERSLKLSEEPEATIVVGNTGSGKSTLMHFLIDPSQVEAIEPENEAEEFKVRDNLDVAPTTQSSTVSKTIVPELIIDSNNTVYYDCPGFSDTRNSSIEIATTYFVKSVTDKHKSLKIVFVVNADSVAEGYERRDFDTMITHGTTLLKNVDKYKTSIALIVSKRAPYTLRGARPVEVTEEKAIESAATFIEKYRNVEAEKNSPEAKIHLVDAMLSKSADGKFNRIGIFFRPTEAGTFDKIPKMVKSRETLLNLMQKNIAYTSTNEDDFGYSLSAGAEKDVRAMSLFINQNITDTLTNLDVLISRELYVKGDLINSLYGRREFYEMAQNELQKVGHNTDNLTPKKLLNLGFDFLTAMNLSIPNDDLKNLATQQRHMNVLSLISREAVLLPTQDWINRFELTKTCVEQEKNWNGFVVYFYEFLSSYDVQKDITIYNVRNIDDWGKMNKPQGLNLHANNWMDFLKKQTGFYELVKPIEMNAKRFGELNELITAALQTPIRIECVGDVANFKGEFVRLSDVNASACEHTFKVHVFAFNKFFVDKNARFDSLREFAVVAHQWEVMQNVRLDLRPKEVNNMPEKNTDGTQGRPSGTAGVPGPPGNSGANFFGYANRIVNGQWFEVDVSGGKGGRGQDGSKAYQEEPSFSIEPHVKFNGYFGDKGLWDYAQGYPYRKIDGASEKSFKDSGLEGVLGLMLNAICNRDDKHASHIYKLYARHCCKSDGLAGAGGLGGSAGRKMTLLSDKSSQAPKIIQNEGMVGDNGKNVEPCKTMTKLVEYSCYCEPPPIIGFFMTGPFYGQYFYKRDQIDTECPREEQYTTYNTEKRVLPTPSDQLVYTQLFSDYKSLIIHNLNSNVRYGELWNIYEAIEKDENVRNSYSIHDIIYELNELEKEFYKMNEIIDFLPFYDNLVNLMDNYAMRRSSNLTMPERKILATLYTAILTKTNAVRMGQYSNMVIDVLQYLDLAANNIRKLDQLGRANVVREYRDQYQNELNAKIDEATKLIADEITPFISKRFKQIDEELDRVMEETMQKANQTSSKIIDQEKALIKLRQNAMLRGLLGSLNIVGEALSFAGPEAKLAGSLIQLGTSIGEQFIVDPDTTADKIQIPKGVDSTISNLGKLVGERKQKKIDALKKELDKLEKSLKDDKEDSNERVQRRQDTTIGELQKRLKEAKEAENPSEEHINQIKDEMKKFVEDETKAIKQDSELKEKKKKRMEKYFEYANNAVTVIGSGVTLYESIKADVGKVEKMQQAISSNRNQLKALQAFEQQIYDKLIPDMMNLHDSIEDSRKTLGTKSHVALDVSKWRIATTIKDARDQLMSSIEGFENEAAVRSCMDKLVEGMEMIVDIYNRIQNYEEHARLVVYLQQLQTAKFREIRFADTRTQALFDGLEFNIQANTILAQYLNAVNAFKQSVFPFAASYLDIYSLPKTLEINANFTLNDLVETVAPQLETLGNRIRELNNTVINKDDPYIVSATFRGENTASPAFYKWRNADFANEISGLFAGNRVYLLSDIIDGVSFNAVKFNTIGLDFIAENATIQNQLNALLENSLITMTHLGTSYYRCGNQFYMIDSPAQEIQFSFKKIRGLPNDRNVVYDKLRNGNNMLSPYAVWSLQLENVNFDQLKELAPFIDIELNGRGQYTRKGVDICKTDLAKYYKLDETISELNDVHVSGVHEVMFSQENYMELGYALF